MPEILKGDPEVKGESYIESPLIIAANRLSRRMRETWEPCTILFELAGSQIG